MNAKHSQVAIENAMFRLKRNKYNLNCYAIPYPAHEAPHADMYEQGRT